MNGTAVAGERVVIVEVRRGNVSLRGGRIASAPSPLAPAENPNEAIVRGDHQFHPLGDTPEEAYEKSFQVSDIHLLKEQEARSLLDPEHVRNWFGSIYQDWVVARIHRALKRLRPGPELPPPAEPVP